MIYGVGGVFYRTDGLIHRDNGVIYRADEEIHPDDALIYCMPPVQLSGNGVRWCVGGEGNRDGWGTWGGGGDG
ncbi:hypothetical protein [Prolixibacter sp. SD074]|uniref:hypothetical protein n=1 Tax=Prolixibacter sp. SD074 TaxID=2652391 RepID=UPI0012781733|nr:hypothetical protein [Prolixibacter sp. SD074]GET30796.1 hypothetical protein SD074_29980 [Prolixibacter sp. SD074]